MVSGAIEQLVTARLFLEPLRELHADEMVSVLSPTVLYDFTGGSPPGRAQLAARYRTQCAGSPAPSEQWFNWIVRTADTDEAIGFVQATVTEQRADVAWLIGVDHQSRGFAAEAATAMVDWLIAQGIERVDARIHPGHLASQRVAAAIGLSCTGQVDEDEEVIWSCCCRPA